MSNSGEGRKDVDEVIGRPEVLAAAEAQLRAASGREARTREILSRILGASPRDVAREVAAALWKPLTAILAAGVLAGCLSDIDSKPPVDHGAASASANPGPSGAAGAGGEPPDPDQWGKMEGALYGNPNFTFTTPAAKPAFDQPATEYLDTAQCEIDGQPFTIFTILNGSNSYNLQFAAGSAQSPEAAMASPTADFIEGLEGYGEISDIASYKDKIFFGSNGTIRMATLVFENGVLKATNILDLPFASDEITILVDNGVPYLYYKESQDTGRVPLDSLPSMDLAEAVPELNGNNSLPAEIIPPDPTTGEGLYFGEKNGIVFAAKKLSGLAASNAVVKELNGNPPAYFTGNVTATPVHDEKGNLIKVYVTFVRQQTEFGKRKLHYIVYSLVPKVDPLPDTDPVPDTDKADAGSTAEPEEDTSPTDDLIAVEEGVIGDADDADDADDGDTGEPGDPDLPWELKDAEEDIPEDVPPIDPDDGKELIDEGSPADPGQPPDEGPKPQDPGQLTDEDMKDTTPKDPGTPDLGDKDPGSPDPGQLDAPETPDGETLGPNSPFKQFTFKLGPKHGDCTATVKPLEPLEANKYGINVDGTGSEETPCVAEVRIEGSDKPAMLYTFWNDVDGNVKSRCYMLDKAGAAKPICEVMAVDNYFDVAEDGEGTLGMILGTVTGAAGSKWTIGYKKDVDEEGNPRNLLKVRNNETGITVTTLLNDQIILTIDEAGVWYLVDAETGKEVKFPEIPNPPEGAESLPIPWELQPEAQNGELATTQPPGSDPTGCAAGTSRRVKAATSEKPAEKPSNPGTFLGTFLILLSTIAGMIVGRRKGKKRA